MAFTSVLGEVFRDFGALGSVVELVELEASSPSFTLEGVDLATALFAAGFLAAAFLGEDFLGVGESSSCKSAPRSSDLTGGLTSSFCSFDRAGLAREEGFDSPELLSELDRAFRPRSWFLDLLPSALEGASLDSDFRPP